MAEVCKWAEFEKCHALTLINEAYDTIYAKFKGSTSGGKDKQAEWNKIAASLNSSGYAQSTRTAHQIKTMHKNIKFKVKSKVDLSKKTGGGPPPVFSQAEQMVLETLKDKPQLSGIVGAIETGSSNLTAHNDDDDIVTDMATLPEEAVLVAEILTVPITEEVQPSTSVSVAEPVVVRRETDRPYRKKSTPRSRRSEDELYAIEVKRAEAELKLLEQRILHEEECHTIKIKEINQKIKQDADIFQLRKEILQSNLTTALESNNLLIES